MADAPPRPLRVLSIAHTAVNRAAGRLRYHPFAHDGSLAVTLVVPSRWHQFGRWLTADPTGDPGARVVALPIRLPRAGPASWYLHTYRGLGREVRATQPDVIHLWEEPWSLVALQASILARRIGAALVLEVDQNIIKRLPPPFEWIRQRVLGRTDLILSRSPDATAVVRTAGYAGPVLPIGYGVDPAVFNPAASAAPAATLFRLGYVGRLVEEKGLDDVFAALAQAPAEIEFAIIGEGPHEAALRARAKGLPGRISFQPWAEPDAVAAFLRGLHALVLPTRTTSTVKEQFGRVIIEAQACGTPVIGSTCGTIPNVVGPGGWIVPERDPAALATLLTHLAAAPDEVAARGRAGLANVAARFTYRAVADDLAQAWRQAARARRVLAAAQNAGTPAMAGAARP